MKPVLKGAENDETIARRWQTRWHMSLLVIVNQSYLYIDHAYIIDNKKALQAIEIFLPYLQQNRSKISLFVRIAQRDCNWAIQSRILVYDGCMYDSQLEDKIKQSNR